MFGAAPRPSRTSSNKSLATDPTEVCLRTQSTEVSEIADAPTVANNEVASVPDGRLSSPSLEPNHRRYRRFGESSDDVHAFNLWISQAMEVWKRRLAFVRTGALPTEMPFLFSIFYVVFGRQFLVTRIRHSFGQYIEVFGLGEPDVAVGDQIWILRGGRLPSILRPTTSSKLNPSRTMENIERLDERPQKTSFIFMGEAYIHGIMDGEAVLGRENDFRPIYLV